MLLLKICVSYQTAQWKLLSTLFSTYLLFFSWMGFLQENDVYFLVFKNFMKIFLFFLQTSHWHLERISEDLLGSAGLLVLCSPIFIIIVTYLVLLVLQYCVNKCTSQLEHWFLSISSQWYIWKIVKCPCFFSFWWITLMGQIVWVGSTWTNVWWYLFTW